MSSNQVLSAIGTGSAEDPWSRFDIRDPFTEYPLPLPHIEENVVEVPSPEDSTEDELMNKINVLEENVMELGAETRDGRQKLEAMNGNLEAEIQNLRKQMETIMVGLNERIRVLEDPRVEELGEEHRRDVAALKAEIGDLRKYLAVLEVGNGILQRKVTALEGEGNGLRDQVLGLDNGVVKLRAENEIFKRKVTVLEEEKRSLRESLETVQRNQNKTLETPLAIGRVDLGGKQAESPTQTQEQVGSNDDHSSSSNEAVGSDDDGSNPTTPSTSPSVEMNGMGGNENQEDGIMIVAEPLRQTAFSSLLDVVGEEDRSTGGHSSTSNPIPLRRTTRMRFPFKKLGVDAENDHIAPSGRKRVGNATATSRDSGSVGVEEEPKDGDASFVIEDPEEEEVVSAEVLINGKANETETGVSRRSKRKKAMEVGSSGKGPKFRRQRVSGSSRKSSKQEWLLRQSDGKYQCPRCPKTYSNRNQRNRHMDSHSPKVVCKECKREYTYKESLIRHLKTCGDHLVKDKKPCKFCGGKFLDRNQHEKNCKERTDSGKQHVR